MQKACLDIRRRPNHTTATTGGTRIGRFQKEFGIVGIIRGQERIGNTLPQQYRGFVQYVIGVGNGGVFQHHFVVIRYRAGGDQGDVRDGSGGGGKSCRRMGAGGGGWQ